MSVRENILHVATRHYATTGYDGTSLQTVAAEVGIRRPSLLYHFPNKEALREAVLDSLLARWRDVLPQVLLAATSGKERLASSLREILSFFAEDPNRARLLLRECLDRPESFRALLSQHLQPWINIVTEAIRQGQAAGRIRPDVDPEAWVVHVVMLVVTQLATVSVGGAFLDDPTGERRIAESLRIARNSLYLDRPPPGSEN